jgi:hypothetical protein
MGSRPAQNPVDQGLSPSSGRQRELNRQEGSVILLYAAPDRGLYESHTAHRSHESVVSADRQRRPMFSTSLRGLDDARKVEAERGGFVWASQQCPRDQTPGSTGHAGHHSSIAPVSKDAQSPSPDSSSAHRIMLGQDSSLPRLGMLAGDIHSPG